MTTPTIELKPSSTPLSDAEREAILANPGFGRYFTDHMVIIKWTEGRGWHDGQLVPYGPLSIDPATNVLHYAQEIFEDSRPTASPTDRWPRSAPRPTPSASSAPRTVSPCPSCRWRRSSRRATCWSSRTRHGFRRTAARSRSTCARS